MSTASETPPGSSRGPSSGSDARSEQRKVIAVTGAKGGVGKSVFAANLGLYLATLGRKVVVVDADPLGANAHSLLGAERDGLLETYVPPPRTFPTFSEEPPEAEPRSTAAPEVGDGVYETPIPGLYLLHAGLDEPASDAERVARGDQLFSRVHSLNADYVVVDLGAGTSRDLLDFYTRADVGLFVTLPEPTAIENTHRFARAAFAQHLQTNPNDREQRAAIASLLDGYTRPPAPLDLTRRVERQASPLAPWVREQMTSFRFHIVLNQTRVRADLELGDLMRTATRRRLGIHLDYLGHIDYDDTVWNCVRMRRPLLVESPGTKASRSIEKIARRTLGILNGTRRTDPWWVAPAESHHDLLEIDRGAADEEIRRAYKRATGIYDIDSLCCYGLFDPTGIAALRVRLEEAYDVLLDPARRRPYELSVFPTEEHRDPSQLHPRGTNLEPAPPAPLITPETLFHGGLLRASRESQRIELLEISQKTKIGMSYLEAIESDDFNNLPARVYVKGFVAEFAKCLGLNAEQVSRTYVRRLEQPPAEDTVE